MASSRRDLSKRVGVFELDPSVPFPALLAGIETALVKLSPTGGEDNPIFRDAKFKQLLLNGIGSFLGEGNVINHVSTRVRVPGQSDLYSGMILKPLRIGL